MSILTQIKKELKANVDPKYKAGSINFFREPIKLYGVRSPIVKKIIAKYWQDVKHLNKKELFKLCEELLKTNHNEDAMIAFAWVDKLKKQYTKSDFKLFESWIKKYVTNWAMCDVFCTHSIGTLITMYPDLIPKVKTWVKSKNRWVRRAAAVSFVFPAKRGQFTKDIFEIADKLLLDEDDLVQKGYGWMLKEYTNYKVKPVFDYVMKKKDIMPRTALRYAIEKMPKDLKKKAMKK